MSGPIELSRLLNILKIGEKEQKMAAVEALVALGAPVIAPLIQQFIEADPALKEKVLTSLWMVELSVDEELIRKHGFRLFTDTTDWEAWYLIAAGEILGRLGSAAATPLIALLQHDDPAIRCWAAMTLGETHAAAAVEPLMESAASTDPSLSKSATFALGKVGDSRAIPVLTRLLHTPHDDLREAAFLALRQMGNPLSADTLIPLLEHPHLGTRQRAAEALGMTNDARAVPPLIALLNKGGHEVYSASAALYRLAPASVEPLIDLLSDPDAKPLQDLVIMELGMIGDPRATEPLILALRFGDERARGSAIASLGRLKDARGVDPLITLMDEASKVGDFESIFSIAQSLGYIATPQALEYLVKCARHPNKTVRSAAVLGLGNAPSSNYLLQQLFEILDHGQPDIRPSAAVALRNIGDSRAVEPMLKALESPDVLLRRSAAEALGYLHDVRAVTPLKAILSDPDTFVQQEAERSLKRLMDERQE